MVQYALIVAGGKGLRMGTELPKQFLPIGGCFPTASRITGGSCAGSTVFHCRMPLQMEGRRGSTP